MIAVAVIVTALLAGGAALALVRAVRGPSVLDRMVATDVLLAIVVVAVAAEAAFSRDATALPVLAVLSILGFTGAVSVARFAPRRVGPADTGIPVTAVGEGPAAAPSSAPPAAPAPPAPAPEPGATGDRS